MKKKKQAITRCQRQPQESQKDGVYRWKHRLEKCIDTDGAYSNVQINWLTRIF